MQYDERFETVRDEKSNFPKSAWQCKCYFRDAPGQRKTTTTEPEGANAPQAPVLQRMDDRGTTRTATTRLQREPADGQPTEPVVANVPQPIVQTRSGRQISRPERYLNFANIANYDGTGELLQQDEHPLAAFAASADPDTLYLNEALAAPDREHFIEAMIKEVHDHEMRGHWEVVCRDDLPANTHVVPSVWSMRRKRHYMTDKVYKWKSRLTFGGHRQRPGIDYDQTFAPVVMWCSIRYFLIHTILNKWQTRQIDFVLAYPQAKVNRPMYMKLPQCFAFEGSTNHHVLSLKQNVYGSAQAGRVWFLHLKTYLLKHGFKQSKVDPCVYFYGRCFLLVYVDDVIIGGPTNADIDELLEVLKDNVDLEDQGSIADYVGVHVQQRDNDTIEMTQPHLIRSILKDLNLDDQSKTASTPALSSVLLHADLDGEDHDGHFNYRGVVGKLNYLEKSTRPDIAFAVHQCARFSANPKRSHAKAVKRIGRYLLATKDQGYIMKPDATKGFECHVDASFAGEWSKLIAEQAITDPNTARSRTGYVLTCAAALLIWGSRLQTEIALSSTEAEMIALSQATRENIFMLSLIADAKDNGVDLAVSDHKIITTVFEDNQGTIAIAKEPRIRPRTKHINLKYWHFITFLRQKLHLVWVDTKDQIADVMTKPLPEAQFHKFVAKIQNWNFYQLETSTKQHERECDVITT